MSILTLSDVPITIDSVSSDVLVEVSHIKKEPLIKIYLFCSASRADVVYRDSERIVINVDTIPKTLFIITRNYITELRNTVSIYILEHEELDLNNLKFDIDIEEECYDNDCDTYFYLKLQTK